LNILRREGYLHPPSQPANSKQKDFWTKKIILNVLSRKFLRIPAERKPSKLITRLTGTAFSI
jgi:hypothetical protein